MLEFEAIALSPFLTLLWCCPFVLNQLEEGSKAETLQAQRCRARLDHLESANADNLNEWNDTRLKRILVDYMLRMSYYDSAIKLAESSNIQVTFVCLEFLCSFTVMQNMLHMFDVSLD